MIYDVLSNAEQYASWNTDLVKVLEVAKAYTPENFPGKDKIVLEEGNVSLHLYGYDTHPAEQAVFEAHKEFIDVVITVDGEETIYVKNVDKLSRVYQEYNAEKDLLLADFDKDATPVAMKPGYFCVIMPQDAHSPGCNPASGACNVKKILAKIRIK